MSKIIFTLILLIGFLCCSCEAMKPRAIGGDIDLIVVVSLEDREKMTKIISAIFNDTLFTPQPEPYYKLKFVDPSKFSDVKRNVNVILGALGTDPQNQGVKLVKQILSRKQYESSMSGDNHLILAENVFAIDQNYLIINGPDMKKIMTVIEDQGPWLRRKFDNLFIKRQSKYLFEAARQLDLEESLMDRYNWSIKIPWGYTVVRDSAELGIFWIGRELPYRWLAVHWEDGLAFSDSTSAVNYAFNFPGNHLENISYSDYKFKMEPVSFNQWGAWRFSGIWEHLEEAQGGPFISYLFYDETSDRTYFLHTMIFHPGRDKYLLLRQVDMVAHSFSLGQ